jgi:hypothetical protein
MTLWKKIWIFLSKKKELALKPIELYSIDKINLNKKIHFIQIMQIK